MPLVSLPMPGRSSYRLRLGVSLLRITYESERVKANGKTVHENLRALDSVLLNGVRPNSDDSRRSRRRSSARCPSVQAAS